MGERKKIPTYFSHSYRPEDRKVNKAIWERFAGKGFYFTVDPPSELTTHTHLETMMLRSSCFVAVVNRREENPPDFCSHFILAEFGMALQSRTPKLVLIDENVPTKHFDGLPPDECLRLDLGNLEASSDDLDSKIGKLASRALSEKDRRVRPRNRVALLVPDGDEGAYGKDVREQVKECAELQGMLCEPLPVPDLHNAHFAMALDKYEFAVLDVRGESLPEWVFAYVYGRFVPTIKIARVHRGELPSSVSLPPLVNGLRMDPNEPGVESVIYWRDPKDLCSQLSRSLKRISRRGTVLRSPEQGVSYFDTIGLPPARLFVSNAWSANDFADGLCQALERHNIEAWQYKQRGAIEAGSKWPDRIEQELEQCDVFVALLDPEYPKSEWCRREMRRARQRAKAGALTLLPFQLDGKMTGAEIGRLIGKLQASPVYRDGAGACGRVFDEIETRLRKDAHDDDDWRKRQPLLLGASREAIIDAIRHVPAPGFAKLTDSLRGQGVEIEVNPVRRKVQPRHVAEAVFRNVQTRARAPAQRRRYSCSTSALVAALMDFAEPERKAVLDELLERIESKMKLRG